MSFSVTWLIIIFIVLLVLWIGYKWLCSESRESSNPNGFSWLTDPFKHRVALTDLVKFGGKGCHAEFEFYQADDWKVNPDGKWLCDIATWCKGKQPFGIAQECKKTECIKTELKADLPYALKPKLCKLKCQEDLLVGVQFDNQLLDVAVNGVYLRISQIRSGCGFDGFDKEDCPSNHCDTTLNTPAKTLGVLDTFEFVIKKHLLKEKHNEIVFLFKNATTSGYANIRIQEFAR
jgi:hypothetical protein